MEDVQVYSGRGRALHLRGHGAPRFLREAPGAGGPPGEPGAQGRPQGRQSHAIAVRVRPALEALAHPAGARAQGGGDPARPAGARHPGGRGLRARAPRSGTRLAGEVLRGVPRRPRAWSTSTPRWSPPRRTLAARGRPREGGAARRRAGRAWSRRSRRPARARRSAPSTARRGAQPVPVVLQLAPAQRARLDQLLQLTVPGRAGAGAALRAGDGRVKGARGARHPAQEPHAGGVRDRRPGRRRSRARSTRSRR